MSRLRVENFAISPDGFGAGPDQDINNPLGVGGGSRHSRAWPTGTFQQKPLGSDSGETGLDDAFAARGFQNVGAWIPAGICSGQFVVHGRTRAGGRGGARTRLIDELHIAISPVLLGSGERLFDGVNLPALGYACVKHEASARATM